VLDAAFDFTSQIRVTCTARASDSIGLGDRLNGAWIGDRLMRDLAGNRISFTALRCARNPRGACRVV
jgi:spore coat protein U-like protein